MKTLEKNWLFILIAVLFISCNKGTNIEVNLINEQIVEKENINEEIISEPTPVVNAEFERYLALSTPKTISELEALELLTDHYWSLSDGRIYGNPAFFSTIDWVGRMTPIVTFRKHNIPPTSIVYQRLLRNEQFLLMYQTEEENKLNLLEYSLGSGFFNIGFDNEFNLLSLIKDGVVNYGRHNRVGDQTDLDYPLVGIWGALPNLTEYRIVDSTDTLYYMDIDKEIPYWAVREGSYLLKQIDENVFETVSSFPDGRLRIEVINGYTMLLTPLFETPEGETGLVVPLLMHRGSTRISELDEEDYRN